MLEQFVKDCLPWEGPHTGAGEDLPRAPLGKKGELSSEGWEAEPRRHLSDLPGLNSSKALFPMARDAYGQA